MARALPDLIARIRLDSSGISEGVGLLQGELSKSNMAIGAAAAGVGVVVGALIEASNKYAALADSVHSYMVATGESAPVAGAQVQAFRELGVSADVAEAGMIKFSKAIELTPKKLSALGIEVVKNANGNVDLNASLMNVIDAYNGTENAALRNAIALTAFGKGGAAMLPILEAGSTALRKLEADVRVTFTDKDIEQAHKLKLEQEQVSASVSSVWESLGQKLQPALKAVTEEYLRTEYATKKLKEQGYEVGSGSIWTADKIEALNQKYRAQWDAANNATAKLATYADAAKTAAAAADALAKSIDNATSSEEASTNKEIALERANLHLAESNDKVNAAVVAVHAAVKQYGTDSDQYRSAMDNFNNTILDQKQAYLDAAGAAQTLAEEQAGPDATATDKAATGHAAYLTKLQEEAATLAPGSALRVYLEQYIARLGAIPESMNTNITVAYQADRGAANRASGGPVLPNSVYTVGEQGPETLVMGPQGGTVIPNSGGGLSKVAVTNGRQDDIVGLLASIDRKLSASPGFSTTAYGRS